jgi:hypothetical protein
MTKTFKIADEVEYQYRDRLVDSRQIVEKPMRFATQEARLATVLIEKWGMVAGQPDGEDSAGRAKFRIMTPDDVVSRACNVAERAVQAFKRRGWLVPLPDFEELESKQDD